MSKNIFLLELILTELQTLPKKLIMPNNQNESCV